MTSQIDAARESARDKASGRFGEQHLADPGSSVLGPTRDPNAGRWVPPVVEPFNPAGRRRPLLWGAAKKRARQRLQVDMQVLNERIQLAARSEAAMNQARMAMLQNSAGDGGLSRALFEEAVEQHQMAQSAVAFSKRAVAEGQWKLGIDKELAA